MTDLSWQYPSTVVASAPQIETVAMRCARLLLSCADLEWRHHGIGVLQAYASTGPYLQPPWATKMDELRFHIWHPDLVIPGIQENGAAHNHRFHLSSVVLLGNIDHVELKLIPKPAGKYTVMQLVNARAAQETTGSFHVDPMPTGKNFDVEEYPHCITKGDAYYFAAGGFHRSAPRVVPGSKGYCITAVSKWDTKGSAGLLVERGKPWRNAFGNPENLDGEAMQAHVDAAMKQLRRAYAWD